MKLKKKVLYSKVHICLSWKLVKDSHSSLHLSPNHTFIFFSSPQTSHIIKKIDIAWRWTLEFGSWKEKLFCLLSLFLQVMRGAWYIMSFISRLDNLSHIIRKTTSRLASEHVFLLQISSHQAGVEANSIVVFCSGTKFCNCQKSERHLKRISKCWDKWNYGRRMVLKW